MAQIKNDRYITSVPNTAAADNTYGYRNRGEFGDWQTNMDLALSICRMIKEDGFDPQVIIEPTCGKGNFIIAALMVFDTIECVYGIDIYEPYIEDLKSKLQGHDDRQSINLYAQNIFQFDFSGISECMRGKKTLIIGNPPWVTNSKLGGLGSLNVPEKSNYKSNRGIEAITGKGNFDIAESICNKMMLLSAGHNVRLAMLVKNSVVKNIVHAQKKENIFANRIEQYNIDAGKEFDVSVSASLLYASMGDTCTCTYTCQVKDFYTRRRINEYGWVGNSFVADTFIYNSVSKIDGLSPLTWRSGLKHDCAKVMELRREGDIYINGLGEEVSIEDELIFPLIKSSDVKVGTMTSVKKHVIVTQKNTNEDTAQMKYKYPNAYAYLQKHSELLDGRGSVIYKKRPRFCLFGIGEYSFHRYKIVVSGLYKHARFMLIEPFEGKVVMADDTCYTLGFDDYTIASALHRLLNSTEVQSFIRSLLFMDAKRAINKELLMRIDLLEAARIIGEDRLGLHREEFVYFTEKLKTSLQPSLFGSF